MKNTNEFPKEKNVNFLSLARSVPCEIQYQGLGWGAILYSDPDFKKFLQSFLNSKHYPTSEFNTEILR